MRIHLFLLLCLSLLFLNQPIIAQETQHQFKKRFYKTRITSNDKVVAKGFLTEISDSAVLLSRKKQFFGTMNDSMNSMKNIHYSKISKLVVKRNGNGGKGYLIGALTGLTIGILIGKVEDKKYGYTSSESNAGIYGFFGFAGGSVLGFIVGSSIKKTFIIGGKKEKFDKTRATMLEKTYRK